MDVFAETNEDQELFEKADNTKSNDLISQLPEDILSSILSFLTMKDAVKTRVLSPRWRYVSASTLDLHFDLITLFQINYSRKDLGKDHLCVGKIRFVTAVDQFLHLFRSPKLHSFKVSYCLGSESAQNIDRWLSSAIAMHPEKLDLDFYVPRGGVPYNFPCHLLPLDEASQLKYLCLRSCMLKPSPDFTNAFNSLKTLNLDDVPIDQSAFDNIFSGCKKLEKLRFKSCKLPTSFIICGRSVCLKSLDLVDCHGAEKIEVSSVELTSFEYNGTMTNLSFVGDLLIEKMHLRFFRAFQMGTIYMFDGLAEEVPQLQFPSLLLITEQLLPLPKNMTKFRHLKELELLIFLYSDFDLLSIVLILNASPYLQKFQLALRHGYNTGVMVEKEYPKQFYYQLKEVEISGFLNRCNALDLAKYLVNNAPKLVTMVIDYQKLWTLGDNRWKYFNHPLAKELEKKWIYSLLSEQNPNNELRVLFQIKEVSFFLSTWSKEWQSSRNKG